MTKQPQVNTIIQEVIKIKENIVGNSLLLGKVLSDVLDNKSYVSDYIKTFDDFLIEVKIGRSTAYNYIGIFKTFGSFMSDKLDIDYTRLVKLLPIVKNADDDEKEEWIHKASELNSNDFDDEIREARGKIPRDTCEHHNTEDWKRCIDCGKMIKK